MSLFGMLNEVPGEGRKLACFFFLFFFSNFVNKKDKEMVLGTR